MENTRKPQSLLRKLAAFILVTLGLGPVLAQSAVVLTPNEIHGSVRFNNNDPTMLGMLDSPGEDGMHILYLPVSSLPPAAPRSAESDQIPAVSRLQADYSVVVDSDTPGIVYNVRPRISLNHSNQIYYFVSQDSAPIEPGVTPPSLDFAECVGLVTLRFLDTAGVPVAVDRVDVKSTDVSGGRVNALFHSTRAGMTSEHLYLRGGQDHRLEIKTAIGTDYYVDRIQHLLYTNLTVNCDGFHVVDVVLPAAALLGRIDAEVDMIGEFEWTIDGRDVLNYPDYTGLIAENGPFLNARWDTIRGDNATTPSSGTLALQNLYPSTLDPASTGYRVHALMAFGAGRRIQYFRTPGLGRGSNPPIVVGPGESVDLSDTFVIEPGVIRGDITMKGPVEIPGNPSFLRSVLFAGDDDDDGDQIPDMFGTYNVYHSSVYMQGVDAPAAGAALTAAHGFAKAGFDGAYDTASSSFVGDYQLKVGGLKGEDTLWNPYSLRLTMSSGSHVPDEEFFSNAYTITDHLSPDVEIGPGKTEQVDIQCCMSEVTLEITSTSGTFYAPGVRFSRGAFTGTDDWGNPADYEVYLESMAGTPRTSMTASNVGLVRMYLPQGTYTLKPRVVPSGSTTAITGLEPVTFTVGCQERIRVNTCLQLNLDPVDCSTSSNVRITGSVETCTNEVQSVTYSLNGGPSQVVCTDCGVNPSLDFNVVLSGECAENRLEVTAHGYDGTSSPQVLVLRYDNTPPEIECPEDIFIPCAGGEGQIVNFTVNAQDNCEGGVEVVCIPPSGSLFPPGETEVRCVATDECGNTTECTFTVTVGGSGLAIQRAVIVTWDCGGVLQEATTLSGPWVDLPAATSPYCAPTTGPSKFYQIRP